MVAELMSLWFACWPETTSMLFDAADEEEARQRATDMASGVEPERLSELPSGAFVVEIVYRDVTDDEEELDLDPFPHTIAILQKLDDDQEIETCDAEADTDDGETVTCSGLQGHDGPHAATTADGAALTW